MQNRTQTTIRLLLLGTGTLATTLVGLSVGRLSAAPPSAAETFKAKCATCHGPDGSGNTPMGQRMKVRDLGSPEVQKQTDDELAGIITKGKPPMPGYRKMLTADDIHQLVGYLRTIAKKS
jgi:cytochrome c6